MKRHKLLALFVLAALILGTLPALAQEPEKTLPPVTVESDANLEAGRAGPSALWPGPDGYGYTGQAITYNWVEISGSGTPISGFTDDNYLGPFPIGFSFSFYGAAYTDFYAASNGYITLGSGVSDLSNDCPLPNSTTPNNMIALMWDDLDPGDTGDLAYYQTFDPCPIGSGACLVVQYDDFCHYPGGTTCTIAGTWEAILYADTGNVILQYEDAGAEEGSGSTEGIEGDNFAAGHGLTYACDTAASVVDGTAVEFLFPTGLMLSPDAAAKQGCEDSDVTHTLTLANYTGADATFDLAYAGVWPVSGPPNLFVANMASANFDVTVSIPCGGVSDVSTVTASGGGYSDASTLTTSVTAGGFTAWEAVDPINSVGRSRPAAAAVDGKIYLFGGEISGGREDTVEMFDPAVGEWVDMAGLMPTPASNICAAAVGTDVYIPGGYNAAAQYIPDLQVYHTATDTWETVTTDPLPVGTAGMGCAALDGKLYAFGGTTGTYLNTAYVYDPAAPAGSRWTALANMTYTRAYLAGTAVNGKVYAVGGRDSATTDFAYVEAYDPADGLWHTLTNMAFTRGGPGAFVWEDQLVACGGGWSLYRNNCESYDTTQGYAGTWVTLGQTMITGRRTFAYASLPEALYAVAGYNGTFLTSAERLPAFTCPGCVTDPDISVSPDALYAEQCADTVTQQTLQICNEGGADLAWFLAETAPKRGFAQVALPARPASDGKGTAAGAVPAHPAGSYTAQGRAGIDAPPNVMLLVADYDHDYGSPIQSLLQAYGDLGAVDLYDPRSQTPTLAELQAYDVVVVWSDQNFSDPAAIGDVLADYVDAGGKVIDLMFALDAGWGYQGRFRTEAYTAMTTAGYAFATDCLGAYDPGHPVMAGVTDVCEYYRGIGTALTAGSTGVAWWSGGELFVGAKDNQTVVTINGYVGYYYQWTGQMPDVLHNAILWLATAAFDAPWLSEDPTSGTVAPGTCQDVTVTFDSTGLAAGDYFANLAIGSNDPDEPQVVVPVQLTVEDCAATMHVADIIFSGRLDPYGRSVARWDVFVHDENHLWLGMVLVDVTITPPDGVPVARSRYTNFLGKVRFHYGHRLTEPWLMCVDNLTKSGYVYEPGDNEVPNCAP